MNLKNQSKFLSYVLRHAPESIGIDMDSHGWVNIDELIEKGQKGITREMIDQIVREDAKQRYAISEDGNRIRANQGHSIEVDLKLQSKIPPVTLYHGTHEGVLKTVLKEGLKKMNRHHVHLSVDAETAKMVGSRRGKPVILTVDTRSMVRDGIKFYISENGVWLTDYVAPECLAVSTT